MEPLENLRKIRLQKLAKIRKLGVDPYPSESQKKHSIIQAQKNLGKKVQTAGRIMALRSHGGSIFADLSDQSGKIQLFFSKNKLSTVNRQLFDLLDIGDFIEVSGKVDKTVAGEKTIFIESFKILTKSLRPIPPSFYGLKDIETRLRKRYLDLIVNPKITDLFIRNAHFWQAVRDFLIKSGFIEVETPALEPVAGGADARPFVTHHHALNTDFYLRISLELYQKRLLVGGFEKVFEIGKIFRNEGIDTEHLQDYLQMEFYWAYADFRDLIEFIPKLYLYIIKETLGQTKSIYQGKEVDWAGRWQTLDYRVALKDATGIDLEKEKSVDKLSAIAKKVGGDPSRKMGRGRLIDLIFKKTVRPRIQKPTLLVNHPADVSPLAKRNPKDPQVVQRVQVLVAGTEVGNGWSELNDPLDQEERFREQQALRVAGDEEAQMYDKDFIEALEYGMPPAVGFGLSQRLFAILVDKPIRETVFFPQVRPKEND